jgi:hypothetical protein
VLRARAWLQHDAIHCGRAMQATIRANANSRKAST